MTESMGGTSLNSTAFMTEKPTPRLDANTIEGSEMPLARPESILALDSVQRARREQLLQCDLPL